MKITSFITYSPGAEKTASQLITLGEVYILNAPNDTRTDSRLKHIEANEPATSSATLRLMLNKAEGADKIILVNHQGEIKFSQKFFYEIEKNSFQTEYFDHTSEKGLVRLTDFQRGSIREGFKFGPVIVFSALSSLAHKIATEQFEYAGLYSLILHQSETELPHHNKTVAYDCQTDNADNRKSGEKQFDYLNPKNRAAQIEFEKAATSFLKRIGAFIDYTKLCAIDFGSAPAFPVKISVIIPVYNRVKTIADAIHSALGQKLQHKFNVIVVDNHSTDGTTEIIESACKENSNLIHIVPEETDLKIGGCWNKALTDSRCGQFAVQLDSDDVYSTPETLNKILNKFEEEHCAMVIGSYTLTDFSGNMLPPGLIDHSEWTPENGMNNAIRINGLGAPRAFYTPVARQILFENCSYGEDYAMGLAISRQFKIGRIYESLYMCRRWEGNSDADLSPEKQNANDMAKDLMRTNEIEKRQLLNKLN